MKVEAKALVRAIQILDKVPMRTGISSSEYVRMVSKGDRLELSLSSDLVGIATLKTTESEDFEFYLERKLLFPFVLVAKGKDKPFTISHPDDSTLVLKEGRRTGKYQSIEAVKGYAKLAGLKEKELNLGKGLIKELRLAAKYASVDQLAPELSCLWIDPKQGRILASNKFSVFVFDNQASLPSGGAIPATFPDLLEDDAKVRISDEGARILFDQAVIYQAFNEKALKDFPKASIEKTMEAAKKWTFRASLPAGKVIDTLMRLGNYISGSTSDETVVAVEAKAGDPLLRFKTGSAQGSFTETLKLAAPMKSDWTAEWLLPSIRPLLEALDPKEDITLRWNEDTPYLFQDAKGLRRLISPRKVGK